MLHGLTPWRMPLANYLKMLKRQEVLALLALKWSFRRIERETGVRRETVSAYARQPDSNPAKTFPGSGGVPGPDSRALVGVEGSNPAKTFAGSRFPPRFAAAAYHDAITEKLDAGLTIQRIYQDLVEDFSYGYSYESVKRYVRTLAPKWRAVGVMHSLPGEEAQVDFFQGPPTLDARSGQWRRPLVFRVTLCRSRHGYEEAVWDQKLGTFLALHENAFRNLGGVPPALRRSPSPSLTRGFARKLAAGRETGRMAREAQAAAQESPGGRVRLCHPARAWGWARCRGPPPIRAPAQVPTAAGPDHRRGTGGARFPNMPERREESASPAGAGLAPKLRGWAGPPLRATSAPRRTRPRIRPPLVCVPPSVRAASVSASCRVSAVGLWPSSVIRSRIRANGDCVALSPEAARRRVRSRRVEPPPRLTFSTAPAHGQQAQTPTVDSRGGVRHSV